MSRWSCALSTTSMQRMEGPANLALDPTAEPRPRVNAHRWEVVANHDTR